MQLCDVMSMIFQTLSIDVPMSPGNPPPMSNMFMLWPNFLPRSNNLRAFIIPIACALSSPHPDPTWKLTPTTWNIQVFFIYIAIFIRKNNLTFKLYFLANRNNLGATISGQQPYLSPNGHFAISASFLIRIINLKLTNRLFYMDLYEEYIINTFLAFG